MTYIPQNKFILYITGISAAGKTTLYESLKNDSSFGDLIFHDIDENGVPPVGLDPWRKYRVEHMLYDAVAELEQGKSTVICGITKPPEVVGSKYFQPNLNIHFLHVKIPFDLFEVRAKQRIEEKVRDGEFNEAFNKEGYSSLLLATKSLHEEIEKFTLSLKNGHTFDTSKLTKLEMHAKASDLIHKIGG